MAINFLDKFDKHICCPEYAENDERFYRSSQDWEALQIEGFNDKIFNLSRCLIDYSCGWNRIYSCSFLYRRYLFTVQMILAIQMTAEWTFEARKNFCAETLSTVTLVLRRRSPQDDNVILQVSSLASRTFQQVFYC